MITKSILLVLLTGGILFTSCKKEGKISAQDEEATLESTVNDAEADGAFDEVFNTTMGIGVEAGDDIGLTGGIGVFGRMEGDVSGRGQRCFTLTVTPTAPGAFPKTVVLDFKDGCLGPDGKLRKGKIITVYTGPMRAPGSKATTTFDGYKVDSMKVEGTHEVVNNSTSNNRILTVRVIGAKLTWDSGRWVRWSTVRTTTQLEGNGTPAFPMDDVFQITGAGRGENSRGITWAHEITEPLIKRFACRWISKGIVRIKYNAVFGLLDFGDGRCDNKATLTINGRTKEITLR
ncbi:MAG TPA: hypothetical protein PKE07_11250 [Lacibacter sp.]|nr:hypothetical protein [Lacibacter sp.]HMO88775.1 hypothetical protein [Lacibacter sp.]